jgi:signal transduction histidine kinase
MRPFTLLWLLVLGMIPWRPVAAAPEPLRDFAGIRSLSRANAAMALPVEIEGVVVRQANSNCTLHDGTCGIFIDFGTSFSRGIWRDALPGIGLPLGTRMKVRGVTDPGGFAPMVLPSHLEILGSAPLPPPLQIPVDRLLSGADDGQRMVLEGVVQGLFQVGDPNPVVTGLRLMVDGQLCMISTPFDCEPLRSRLDDARVRITGVFSPTANLRSQMAGIKMDINSPEDIVVIKEPSPDPFLAPKVTVDALFQFSPDTQLYHRIVTSGVVSYAVPGRFYYLQNGRSGVRVTSEETGLRPGDRVEVSAFLDTSRILASLKEARTRVVDRTNPPAAEFTRIAPILHPEIRNEWEAVATAGSDYDGRLIRLNGILRRVIIDNAREHTANLLVESDGEFFQASVPLQDPHDEETARRWSEGSDISLTGVCELQLRRNEVRRTEKAGWLNIDGLQLLLAGPGDLRILQAPSWWTVARLAAALAALAVVLALSMAWVMILRRQVALRGARLAAEISARETAAREFEATLRERRRLASDLHDSLEQTLTGLALQLEAAELFRTSNPDQGAHHLRLASKFLDRSREDVRRTVWDLRTDGLGGQSLTAILRERTASLARGGDSAVEVLTDGQPASIPDFMAGNLLLAAQEAVTNALKHSGSNRICVTVHYRQREISLTIADHGCGFDPASAPGQRDGHFGLQGMRERLKRLGGSVKLDTTPGGGTTVTLSVPLSDSPLAPPSPPV